jgi:hypothetical protein
MNLSYKQNSIWFTIIFLVAASHLGLLGILSFWTPAPLPIKPHSKVIVQTIHLKPTLSTTVHPSPSTLPTDNPVAIPVINSPLPTLQQELTEQASPSAISTPTSPPPSPIPTVKTENKPPPKPNPPSIVQESKKTVTTKKAVPVKKTSDLAKKPTKNETTKTKEANDLEKKRQAERIEAEKKGKLEQAEAEKKRQKDLEIEKKRQQELAAAKQLEQTLLAKAKENLAKMNQSRDKITTSSSSLNLETAQLPQELENLQIDRLLTEEKGNLLTQGNNETSYSLAVSSHLKKHLRLPDYGDVKMKLTLNRNGQVMSVEIMRSESNKNKAYVENHIPNLVFPPFGQRFQGVSQNVFVITLQNDS